MSSHFLHAPVLTASLLFIASCTFEMPTTEKTALMPLPTATSLDPQATRRGPAQATRDDLDPQDSAATTAEAAGGPDGTRTSGSASSEAGRPGAKGTETPAWTERVMEPAVALAAGAAHVCALSDAGAVSCWGRNDVGQLGYGHTESIGDDEPAASHGVVNVGGPVVALAAGRQHTCAILEKGSVRCWGFGGDLALGNGNGHYDTIGDDESPGDKGDAIVYSNSAFVQLAAGDHHTCVRTALGAVKCWGDSPPGALGYGYATVTGGWLGNVPIGETVTSLVAGGEHTCVVVQGGVVRCWGEGSSIGYGGADNIGDDEQPSEFGAHVLGEPVTQLTAGDRHTCALAASGAVRCWGLGELGVLGYANTQAVGEAVGAGIVNLGGLAVQIAAGRSHTCALMLNGSVRCWGEGSGGALGYGSTADVGDNEVPAAAGVVRLTDPVLELVAGDDFTCALLESGAVQCWGSGLDGRLGYGSDVTIGDDETPDAMGSILPFGQ